VAQEIYLRLLRFADPELIREPRAYLYRVARNVLHDWLRLEDREHQIADVHEPVLEDQSSQVDDARELEYILSKLPELYRAVLVLRKAEGLSYEEIAARLNISVHTVKKYMHCALVECRVISLGRRAI